MQGVIRAMRTYRKVKLSKDTGMFEVFEFVSISNSSASEVYLDMGDRLINGKRLLEMLAFMHEIPADHIATLVAEGADADRVLERLAPLLGTPVTIAM